MMTGSAWNSESLFQAILDRCPVGIAVINYDGHYVTVNPAYGAIYGYTQEEMAGRSFTMVFPESARDSVLARHRQFLDEGGTLGGEWTVMRRDGVILTIWSESVPFAQHGHRADRLVYVLDITERQKAREQMKIAAAVYESTQEAIIVINTSRKIISINPAFTRLTGYSAADVVGQPSYMFKSDRHDADFYTAMWRTVNEDGVWVGEMWDRKKDGSDYLKEMTINVIKDSAGTPINYVGVFSDITQRKKQEALIWRQANYDAVTTLPNRHHFQDKLERAVEHAKQSGRPMALMLIDLDHFKSVNDSLGHRAGDALLLAVSNRLTDCVQGADTIARLGGDEFAIILTDLHQNGDSGCLARTLLAQLAQPFNIDGESMLVSASIGIALFPNDSDTLEELFKNADQAMYAAKSAGRNCFNYYTPALHQAARARLRLTNDLRTAIQCGQFEVYYQPIIELSTNKVVKAEALVRWRHPIRGMISPAEFIPLAEDTGLIVPLGDWVARQAITQLAQWRKIFDPHFQVAINQSPVQLRSKDFTEMTWVQELAQHGLEGNAVIIEITEGLLLNAESRVNDNLHLFRDTGIQIAIDDFGTGYSSLAYLRKFDIDCLKIDRSFVEDLDGVGFELCVAIIAMAHSLGLKVVAEGVETQQQCDTLARIGCDYAQGFLFSRPVPAPELTILLLAAAEPSVMKSE
ncbi:EAL domain-containing protein [Dickeya chrysanthemi]|uniref:putative bifunctional diguanylate cyclase/phosphodiesterase n=1 Tax=Dickeya chrysanthemi TaxID=556 RepID=UPI0025A2CC3A|nr:bifunctional diguanylate cyclase/phosphodiesterase [Dickeya chrysanthemi]WJM84606.1 EAL domain-containing protein [Dickeya chrysanthemi]